jgi:hypothetical protein
MLYSRIRYSLSWLVLWCGLFGCAADHDPMLSALVREEGGGSGGDDDEYVGHQGRLLLGFRAPDIRTFVMSTSLVGLRVIDDGELVANGYAGRAFIGQPVVASADGVNMLLRITDVREPAEAGARWQYALEQYVPQVQTWIPACAEPPQLLPGDPVESPPLAMAMPGSWSRDGLYSPHLGFSFACNTGAVAKCDDWGYRVDSDPPNVTENGIPTTTVTGADMMQACTRMARADFCAQGIPNTFDGTPIRLDDVFQDPPFHRDYVFEAAWPGLAVVDRTPRRLPVICLSKLRWSTLPLGGTCPLQLPDPRVDSKGKFCDDILPKVMEEEGARTYSLSSYLDAGLYTYSDPATGTRLTTSRLVPAAAGLPPDWLIPQPPSVPFPMTGQGQRFEATIFAPVLPSDLSEPNLLMLRSYQCPDGDYITTTSSAPGCTEIADEGHVYPPGTTTRAPLRRWWHPNIKRSHTTAIAPTTMIASGWQQPEVVGGVIRAGIDVNLRWSAIPGASYSLAVQTRSGEWIAPCIDTPYIGTATSFVYRGTCNSASFRAVDHADIASVRVTATSTAGTQTGNRGYNGFDSDHYIDVPGGAATAVTVTWNNLGQGFNYSLDVRTASSDWIRCVGGNLLGNGLSHVHTGSCPAAGGTIKLVNTFGLRVCATWNGDPVGCGEVNYSGGSRAHIEVESSM